MNKIAFLEDLIGEIEDLDSVEEVVELLNEKLEAEIEEKELRREDKFREILQTEDDDPDFDAEKEFEKFDSDY